MAEENSEDIIGKWLFRYTGLAILAALQVVGLAILSVADKHIPKSGILTVIGAQIMLLALSQFVGKKQLDAKRKHIRVLEQQISIRIEDSFSEKVVIKDIERNTLKAMGESGESLNIGSLVSLLDCSKLEIQVALDELRKKDLVRVCCANGVLIGGPTYSLMPKARKWLVENQKA